MANRWCDGFGRYGGTKAYMLNGSSGQAWAQIDGDWTLSAANPRTGTHHLRLDGTSGPAIARRVFGDPLTEVFFGRALYFDELPVQEPIIGGNTGGLFLSKFRSATNQPMVSVWAGTDGSIAAYLRGETSVTTFAGTLLGRSSPVIGAGAYQHFEEYLKVGNGDGAYEMRVNEVTVLNLTGLDTDFGSGEVSQIAVGKTEGPFASAFSNLDMADCFVNDTVNNGSGCDSWIGDCKSGVRMVDADSAQADFALSSGVIGFGLLDETPPNDTDYIHTDASTAESDFGLANGAANVTEILTVRPFVRALKDDAGTCTIAPSLKSNDVKASVPSQPVTEAAAYYDSEVPVDPNTGVPWIPADLNAALHVVERTA